MRAPSLLGYSFGRGNVRKDSFDGTSKRKRGRPHSTQPLRRWSDYIEVLERFQPRRYSGVRDLHEMLRREAPSAVQPNLATFRRVLNGQRPARPGFADALIRFFGVREIPVSEDDFESVDTLSARFAERAPSTAFDDLLKQAADGTRIELRERRGATDVKAFVRPNGKTETVLRPGVTYVLDIVRPEKGGGTSGHVCLLGYGIGDGRWQLVSAFTNTPLNPERIVPWGRMTAIELTVSDQGGRFLLYALGSIRPFLPALNAIHQRERENSLGDGFLRADDVRSLFGIAKDCIARGAWSAKLAYRVLAL